VAKPEHGGGTEPCGAVKLSYAMAVRYEKGGKKMDVFAVLRKNVLYLPII